MCSSVQSFSHVQLFAIPWTAACQASLYITNSQSLLKLMSIESVMPSIHFILCHPLLLPPSIFPSIRSFPMSQFFASGGQSIRASAPGVSMNIQGRFSLGLTGLISLQSKGLSRVFSNTTVKKHHFFSALRSLECQVDDTAGVGETTNWLQLLQKRSGGDGVVHEPFNLTCYHNAVSVIK